MPNFHPSHDFVQSESMPWDYSCKKCVANEMNNWLKYSCEYIQQTQPREGRNRQAKAAVN